MADDEQVDDLDELLELLKSYAVPMAYNGPYPWDYYMGWQYDVFWD